MKIWLIMALAGLVTYLLRLSFIQLFGLIKVPPRVISALRYVPAAVFSAIIFPELLMPGGTLSLTWKNSHLLAGALAVVVAWKTRSVVWTILSGMLALLALQYLLRL
jgi:branched-subunit amino acid transport protein